MILYKDASIANYAQKYIFICGGYNDKTIDSSVKNAPIPTRMVQCFDIKDEEWSLAPLLNKGRVSHASCALGKYLYVFLGYSADAAETSIERLTVDDPDAEWELL